MFFLVEKRFIYVNKIYTKNKIELLTQIFYKGTQHGTSVVLLQKKNLFGSFISKMQMQMQRPSGKF